MTGMLASVANLDEALQIASAHIDIIDLKAPAAGALGALKISEVKTIKQRLGHQHVVSATIGDLPMEPDVVRTAVRNMLTTGVDYVKIGFFPGGDRRACLRSLSKITHTGAQLIAVLFADNEPEHQWIRAIADAGFAGVMLDTMRKSNGALTQICRLKKLAQFVDEANRHGLITGLAGSLRVEDVPTLLKLNPDYLGFRGALCQNQHRTDQIDAAAVQLVRSRIPVAKYRLFG